MPEAGTGTLPNPSWLGLNGKRRVTTLCLQRAASSGAITNASSSTSAVCPLQRNLKVYGLRLYMVHSGDTLYGHLFRGN